MNIMYSPVNGNPEKSVFMLMEDFIIQLRDGFLKKKDSVR